MRRQFSGPVCEVEELQEALAEARIEAKRQRQRAELLEAKLEAIGDGIWEWDLVSNSFSCNERFAEMLGYSLDEIEDFGCFCDRNIHPADRLRFQEALRSYLSGNAPEYALRFRLRTYDGSYKWLATRGRVVERSPEGEPRRMVGTHTDLDELIPCGGGRVGLAESQMRDIADALPVLVGELDPEGRQLFVNRAKALWLGKKPEEVLGSTANELSPELVTPAFTALMNRALSGERVVGELEFDHPRLGRRELSLRLIPRLDTEGRVVSIVSLADDMTGKETVEATLSRSRDHIHSFTDLAPVVFFEIGSDLKILSVNKRCETVFGRPVEEIVGSHLSELLGEEHWRSTKPHLESALLGESVVSEVEVETIGGARRFQAYYVPNPGRRDVESVFVWALDVTNLRHAEQRLRAMFDHMRTGVAVYRPVDGGRDFVFEDFNPEAERITKASSKQIVGRRLLECFPSMREFGLLDALRRVWQTGIPETLPPAFYRDERREGWRENFLYRLPSGEVVAMFNDVTEHVADKHALERAKEDAEAASRVKSEFLATVSHELRTPLNGIMGMLQLLMDEDLNPEQSDLASTAYGSAKRLTSLIADILDISIIEAGKMSVKMETFDPRELLDSVAKLFAAQAAGKNIRMHIHAGTGLPQAIYGDPSRLRQIIFNLLGNAIKFSDGEVRLHADLLLPVSRGGWPRLYLEVIDQGPGIPEDKLHFIFETFAQTEASATRIHQGAGLGLAIVKRLVHLLGGNLSVDSALGEGATFYVTVPVGIRPESGQTSEKVQDVSNGSMRLLLVEDDQVNRTAILRMLAAMGHEAEYASDGQEALSVLRERGRFDAVLMDIQMPVMDGRQATRAIRRGEGGEIARDLPIAAITAHAMRGDREAFLADGMDRYLAKPIEKRELRDLLEELRCLARQRTTRL